MCVCVCVCVFVRARARCDNWALGLAFLKRDKTLRLHTPNMYFHKKNLKAAMDSILKKKKGVEDRPTPIRLNVNTLWCFYLFNNGHPTVLAWTFRIDRQEWYVMKMYNAIVVSMCTKCIFCLLFHRTDLVQTTHEVWTAAVHLYGNITHLGNVMQLFGQFSVAGLIENAQRCNETCSAFVFFLLGDTPMSELYVATFRNTVPSS